MASGYGNRNSADSRSLNQQLDFEEQLRTAEIQLEGSRRRRNLPVDDADAQKVLEEEERMKKMNHDSILFNSHYRLSTLSSAMESKQRGSVTIPLARGLEKKWLHNVPDSQDWFRKTSDNEKLPSSSSAASKTSVDERVSGASPLNKATGNGNRNVNIGFGQPPLTVQCQSVFKETSNTTPTVPDAKKSTAYAGIGRGRESIFSKYTPVETPEMSASDMQKLAKEAVTESKNNGRGGVLSSNSKSGLSHDQSVEVIRKFRLPKSPSSSDSNVETSEEYFSTTTSTTSENEDNFIKLVDRAESRVAYGCISIGDEPGITLVRGSMLMPPLDKIEKFIYYSTMKKSLLNNGLDELNSTQKCVAPHFLRGDDCFIIGGHNCGKSLSYLIPMVGSLFQEFCLTNPHADLQLKLHSSGPFSIIICQDYKSAIKIEGHLHNLVANRLNVALVCDDHKETRGRCEVEVDIMVTTLTYAADMLNTSHVTHVRFRFDRLRYLVFDGVDVLLRSAPEQFETVKTTIENHVLKCPLRRPYQRVFCGLEWNDEVEDLYFRLCGLSDPNTSILPTVHIRSRNQAIRYSKMKWNLYDVIEEEKVHKIVGLLRSSLETALHRNIFILCSIPEVAFEVHTKLEKQGIQTLLAATDKMSTSDVLHLTKLWENSPGTRRILVLHDAILKSLKIYDVTCLIHYDLPIKDSDPKIKSAAGANRFSCMWGYFRDIAEEKENRAVKYQRQELVAHFLLTGKERELHKLKQFALKMGTQMPKRLSAIADEMGIVDLERKPICSGITLYGKCVESVPENCRLRHTFLLEELQKPPTIDRSGEIEVKITNCVNPSSYIGQVIRYYEVKDGKKILKNNLINLFNERTKKLNAYYAFEVNKVPPESFETGTYCSVDAPLVGFARAKIEKVMTRTSMGFPKTVRVYCVDHGEFLQPLADDLFALPPGYEELQNLAVNIVLANLQPPDGASDYRPPHIKKAKQITQEKILHGKIRLSVDNTVWLNPLVEMDKDPCSQQAVKGQSIRLELISQKGAENNDWHIMNLIELCKSVGFTCPEFQIDEEHLLSDTQLMSTFFHPGDEFRWAFVPPSTMENPDSVEIWTTFIKDPYNIFGVNEKFDEQLNDLISDLNRTVTGMIADQCEKYDSEFSSYYEIGLVVAVMDQIEKKWLRGIIMNQYEKEGVNFFDVYFVDVGDNQKETSMKEMFPMPYDLVRRLPFQAVAFELAHIKPVDSSDPRFWDEDAINQLMEITLDENGDALKFTVAALQSKKHPILGCRYYSAMILMDNGDEMGEHLVKQHFARFAVNGQETVDRVKYKLLMKYNQLYDNRNAASVSDDEDQEDHDFDLEGGISNERMDEFDIQGFDFSAMAQAIVSPVLGRNGLSQLPINDTNENRETLIEHEHDQAGAENHNNVGVLPSTSAAAATHQGKSATASTNKEPAVAPLSPFSDLLHPKVFWRQTKNQFILVINHPDIKIYTLNIQGQNVSFRTEEPKGYGFDLACYGRLDATPDVFETGQYLRIKLNKRVTWKWPKALKDNVKYPWFKEDPDNVHSSDEEEESETKSYAPMPANYDKDESDDDTDDLDSDDDDPEETGGITL